MLPLDVTSFDNIVSSHKTLSCRLPLYKDFHNYCFLIDITSLDNCIYKMAVLYQVEAFG